MAPFHLNRTSDLDRGQLEELIGESLTVAKRVDADLPEPITPLRDKLALWASTKGSFRTECSENVAVTRLGGRVLSVDGLKGGEAGKREPLKDIIRCGDAMGVRLVFSRMHTKAQTREIMAAARKMSVINALDDEDHPLQSFADAAALVEADGWSQGKKVVFVGPGNNNVTMSLAEVSAMLGWDFVHTGPQGHRIPDARFAELQELARLGGGSVRYVEDWREAVPDARMIYTDVHTSMGQEAQARELEMMLAGYKVTEEMMARAGKQARFGHCLPAKRGIEVDDAVMEADYSMAFNIAGHRAHTATGMLLLMHKGKLKAK